MAFGAVGGERRGRGPGDGQARGSLIADGDAGCDVGTGVPRGPAPLFPPLLALLVGARTAQGKAFRRSGLVVVDSAGFGLSRWPVGGVEVVLDAVLKVLRCDPQMGGPWVSARLVGQLEGHVLAGRGLTDQSVEVPAMCGGPGAVPLVAAAVAAVGTGQWVAAVAALKFEFFHAAAYQKDVAAGEGCQGQVVDSRPGSALDEGSTGVIGGPQRAQAVGVGDVAAPDNGAGGRVGVLDLVTEGSP